VIDPNSDRAAFRQLADILRERILSGELAPGAALPSENTLTQEYGLARNTVRQAIAILRSEGRVVVRPPHGTFVREAVTVETVTLNNGDTATARAASEQERRSLDIADGVPVVVVERSTGETETHPGDRVRLVPGKLSD
jgi:DNA-binding GntR family transcriptional regulator